MKGPVHLWNKTNVTAKIFLLLLTVGGTGAWWLGRGQEHAAAAFRAWELCRLHKGTVVVSGRTAHGLRHSGVTCAFPNRAGVQSLWKEYTEETGVIIFDTGVIMLY